MRIHRNHTLSIQLPEAPEQLLPLLVVWWWIRIYTFGIYHAISPANVFLAMMWIVNRGVISDDEVDIYSGFGQEPHSLTVGVLLATYYEQCRKKRDTVECICRYVAMTMHDPRNVVRGLRLEIHYNSFSLEHQRRRYSDSLTIFCNIKMFL